ncbi:citrate/2-methylcitrate synthase [Lentisalinibacter orientalis]|uniref:citrate/2-methylcitrate synthase n=1 Tax=Lentisalinibacter orientalis TaxID=2992241 RepID=UPI0038674686
MKERSGNSSDTSVPRINRGLKGVYFDRSPTTFIDGRAGELLYAGYSIHDLASQSTFEEVCYLLLNGELPTRAELAELDHGLKEARVLAPEVVDTIRAVARQHPMQVLRTCVSLLEAFDEDAGDDSEAACLRKGLRLTSQVPMIVAAQQRIREDEEPIDPDPALGHAANFLYMLSGSRPSEATAALMDRDLILHAEHGANASAFAARVVTGTRASLHAAMTAAVAALSGSAHGGAAEDVMQMAQEIGSPENAAAYVREKRARREAIMGFGHRVYRSEDPRARHLRKGVEQLSQEMGQPQWFEILQAVVEAMKPYSRLGVNVNVDFYAGVIYHLLGIPKDVFVPVFAIGRVPGWTAQILEQVRSNILIRPLTLYNGPGRRSYSRIDERG